MISLFKPKISVKTHIGYFQYTQNEPPNSVNTSVPYLFITVRNNTNKSIIINRVCQNVKTHYVDINISHRSLPFTLEPGKSWETWRSVELFSKNYNMFTTMFADVYIDGKLKRYKSKFDKNCPSWGPVPDGSY